MKRPRMIFPRLVAAALLPWVMTVPPARAGDIAGTASPSGVEPGTPLLLVLRGPEMQTTRRSGPLRIERLLVSGRLVGGSPAPVTGNFDVLRRDDRLVITNRDDLPRHLFAFSGAETRDLGALKPGDSATLDLARPGPVEFYTDALGAPSSYVFVADNAFFKEIEAGRGFVMDGVPPGQYDLSAWRPGRPLSGVPVTVPYEGTVTVRIGKAPKGKR